MSKRTFKEDKLAKIYDAEVVPIWSRRFGRMLLRDLVVPKKAMVLDANCGSGYPSLEILRRMDDQGRIIAIDSSSPMLDEARTKAGKLSGKRIFFRSESALPKLPFADQVYDLVVANTGLQQLDDPEPAVRECARVTKMGGQVIATYPLAGTFGEFYDIFREVLVKGDYKDALDRLDAYLTRYPPLEQAVAWFEDAGLREVTTEYESFTLLFKSSREFFFAPIIEYGPLSSWKSVAGKGQQMQDVFWQTKASIDAYFHGSAFAVTVNAGCVRGRKLAPEPIVSVDVPGSLHEGSRDSSKSGRKDAPEIELPDAPSDDVDALSGSWPALAPEHGSRPRELVTGETSGLSVIVGDDSGEIIEDEPVGGLDMQPVPEDDDDDDVDSDDIEAASMPVPKIAEDADAFDPQDAAAFDAERAKALPVIASSSPPREGSAAAPEGSGSVQLGTGEIELIEGSEADAELDRVRKVRRPDDPDDPDIF